MGNHVKVNKSEIKNAIDREMLKRIYDLEQEMGELYKRLDRLECKWDALIRRLEGVARHPEDEGWFD